MGTTEDEARPGRSLPAVASLEAALEALCREPHPRDKGTDDPNNVRSIRPGPRASLVRRDLRGQDLSGLDLSGADLTEANLTGTQLVGTNLSGACLAGARLDQAELAHANLRGANLDHASTVCTGFGHADLRGATLFGIDAEQATFSGANLVGVSLASARLEGARFRDADLTEADLTRSLLRGADLTNARIDRAKLTGADLRSTTLRGVSGFTSATFVDADIRDVDFSGAYLVRRHIMDENYLHEFRRQSALHRAIHFVWWLTSDCGRSLTRWGVFTAFVVVAFGFAYRAADVSYGAHETALSPWYYSVVTVTTLGYGDVLPASAAAQVLAMSEAVVGYVLLGGLLSIFANKMARRAE